MSEPQVSIIVISGPFTAAELAEVVALIRRIDDTRPGSIFQITAVNPDATLEEAEHLMREVLPPKPGRETALKVWRGYPPESSEPSQPVKKGT
jgi:hypothetical protein